MFVRTNSNLLAFYAELETEEVKTFEGLGTNGEILWYS
jgi:hypothetical protein